MDKLERRGMKDDGRAKKRIFWFLVIMFIFSSSSVFLPSSFVYAETQIPHFINYQGRLTDANGAPLDGTYTITFRIYDATTLRWQGTYSVAIQKGVFNVLLGDVNDPGYNFSNLSFDKPYYLAIKVGSDPEMYPRHIIAAVGYAIRAEKAESAESAKSADKASSIETRASDPSSPTTGQIWLRTD